MVTFLRTDFKSLNRKPEKVKTDTIKFVNWQSKEALKFEFESLPSHLKEYLSDLFESMTDEEKQKLKLPTGQQLIHFYSSIQKLCKTVGKNKAMDLLIEYSEKIVKLKDEFPESARNYAKALQEFAKKYKKGVFDVRLVDIWLYNKAEFENFISGSLHLTRSEYLFNKLGLGLT